MSFIMDELHNTSNETFSVLPEECVITMIHEEKTAYDELDPAEVLSWIQGESIDGTRYGHWKPSDVSAFRSTFRVAIAYVLNWLEDSARRRRLV